MIFFAQNSLLLYCEMKNGNKLDIDDVRTISVLPDDSSTRGDRLV